ncbi:MAG: thiol reductant ABC exporter subunit CydD [Vicinamibacterales bacterium]
MSPSLAICLGALAGVLVIPQAVVLAGVLAGLGSGGPVAAAAGGLAWLAALAVARASIGWASDTSASQTLVRLKARLRDAHARRALGAGPRRLEQLPAGSVTSTLTAGLDALDAYVARYQVHRALAVLVPVAVVTAVVAIDPLSAAVLVVTGPLIPLFMWLIGGIARERTAAQWVDLSRLTARFLDAVQGLVTLKAFGRVAEESVRLGETAERYRRLTMDVLRVGFLSALVLELLATLGTAIVAVEIGLRLLYGRVAFPEALAVLLLAPEFYRPLRTLGQSFHAGLAGQETGRQLAALDDALGTNLSNLSNPTNPTNPTNLTNLTNLTKPPRLSFTNVRVDYGAGRGQALAGFSMEVAAGELLGLDGPSGAGKSTLLAALLRFVDPADGAVLVDGVRLDAWTPDAWRAAVSWAPQRPHLFHGTLLDNLRLGAPAASEAEVRRAMRLAAFDRVVDRLPRGLATRTGELGAGLSGGEAQRLALARAYLKAAPLLLLDEPTSELDADTEAAVVAGLAEARMGRTVLLVSHRRATLAAADRVVRMAGGRRVP